jgi:hypothetical protein
VVLTTHVHTNTCTLGLWNWLKNCLWWQVDVFACKCCLGHTHPLSEIVVDLALFSSLFQCCDTQIYYFLIVLDPVMLTDLCLGIWAILACSHGIICILCQIYTSSLKNCSPGPGRALYDGFVSACHPWALSSYTSHSLWAKLSPHITKHDHLLGDKNDNIHKFHWKDRQPLQFE